MQSQKIPNYSVRIKKNKHFVIKTMCCKQLICENYLFAIPQTSFLVGTFFAATYSKDGSIMCSLHHDLWYFKPKKYSNSFIVGFKHPCCLLSHFLLFLCSDMIQMFTFIGRDFWMKFNFLINYRDK